MIIKDKNILTDYWMSSLLIS